MEVNKIDIIISLYNKENEIEKCITSILNQILLPNKIIIVNNNSTDNSISVVEKIINDNKNISIELINEKEQGAQYARYTGAMHSKSNFVSFLDADDYMLENHLKIINILINKYSDLEVFCSSYIYESNNKILNSRNINDIIISRNKKEFFKSYFLNRGMICSSNITCKRTVISDKWIENSDRIGEDLSIWFDVISKRNFVCANYNSIVINKTPVSSNSSTDEKKMTYSIINKNLIKLEESDFFFEKMVYARRIIYVDFFIGFKSLFINHLFLYMFILEFYRLVKLKVK